jgi:hypothetical protein
VKHPDASTGLVHEESVREVHVADAIAWLGEREPLSGCSMITSLPDRGEFAQWTLDQWKDWFVDAAALVLSRTPDEGVAIFYQSDIKVDGAWIDKAYLVQKAAERTGHSLLWHKIVCRAPVGNITHGRPAYSHVLCFSKGVRAEMARSTADVLPEAGETTWTRGMGLRACEMACRFVLEHTATRTVVDPFCGHGTVLAMATHLGLGAIGVELGGKRARKARALRLSLEGSIVSVRTQS